MRLLPRSLTGRLLVTAGVAMVVALFFAALSIGHVLERFVMHGLDERLDAQIAIVGRSIRADGRIEPAKAVDLPPFDQAGSGWAWEVIVPGHILRSGSLGPADLPLPPDWNEDHHHGWHRPWEDRSHPRPLDGFDAAGQPIHYRIATIPTARGDAFVIAAGPRAIVERPLRAAMGPLLISLLLLGAFLALALIVQLRIGLRPLSRITRLLGEVREGRLRQIHVEEPTELLPLVTELNALITANERALERARGHVANLAHGLKTPLATLRLDLADPRIDADGRLGAQIERMEGQIRHHLGRARAAEPGGTASGSVVLHDCIDDLVQAMARIHTERAIVSTLDVPPSLMVRCDPQDLDELLGNILDNGWRWASTTVEISAHQAERRVSIEIADDGPGMSDTDLTAFAAGRRLDERDGGHGFGLSISRELAELHGGSLALEPGTHGGMVVRISLPMA